MDIQLNFINQSNDANNSEILIFQKNVATDFEEVAVAWQVIKYCAQGDNHPFKYATAVTVGASDSYGNYTPQLPAAEGESFQMVLTASGDQLRPAGQATSTAEVQVLNALPKGAINALVYRGGKLAAQRTNVAPGQKAVFQFKPTLWIGVCSQVEQGDVINSAIMSNINTELSLLGIASADIVMTGGGVGPNAQPFQFTLENVMMV